MIGSFSLQISIIWFCLAGILPLFMAVSNVTSLNDLVGSVVDSLVQEYGYAKEVMRHIIREGILEDGANSVVIPRWDTIAIAGLTEATAPANTVLGTGGATLTPTERGVLVTISKLVLRSDPFNDLDPYARTLGRSMGNDSDAQILATMESAGFSVIVNNGAGTVDMTLAHFRLAITTLMAADAPTPYFCVMHPLSWAKIMDDLDDAASFGIPGRDVIEGHGWGLPKDARNFVAAPYGVPVFLSSNVDATRDTNATYCNMVFSKEAWGFARTYDYRVDVQENKPARALDAIAWYAQDQKELVDAWGVTLEDQV